MDLFEYQGKQLFARAGIPVPSGEVATTPAEAEAAARAIGTRVAVKAQVQVGGRGKAGGIKVADTPEEARVHAEAILGMDIKGHVVRRVWVEAAADIAEEYYCSFTLDRAAKQHLGMMSAKGGIDIETVAAEDPDAIARVHVDPVIGLQPYEARELVFGARINPAAHKGALTIVQKSYEAFRNFDCDLVEINPLILTTSGDVLALDAKVSLDANADFRHPEFEEYRGDALAIDPLEAKARAKGLNFIKLDGEVGIIGNGAGLVMSTLDVVAQAGGRAANFLDVGGGAGAETVTNALDVLSSDPSVRSVLINIFGGITRCDLVAQGIVDALNSIDIRLPIVVRLDGTNAEAGRELLARNASDILHPAATMLEAAARAVELAKV